MQKVSIMTILVILCYFQGLGTCLESKEETSVLTRCCILCTTSTGKNLRE